MNKLSSLFDSKIKAFSFDFDASIVHNQQNLLITLELLPRKILLKFIDVSNFKIDICSGIGSVDSNYYTADCLYIADIQLMNRSNNHFHWKIELVKGVGCFEIFADELEVIDII